MKRFLPLYLVTFLAYVGYAMSLPLFTAMLLDTHHPIVPADYTIGDRTTLLGFLLCSYPFGQFLGAPVLGAFSDHFGRRPVLLFSLICTSILYAVVGLSIHLSLLPLLFATLFLAGLLEGSIGIAQSFIADHAKGHKRTVAFGYTYSSGAIGFIVGSLLAGELSNPDLVSWFSYSTPFYMLTGLLLFSIPVVALYLKQNSTIRSESIEIRKALTSFQILFAHPVLRWTFAVSFLFYLTVFGCLAGFAIYVTTTYNLSASRLAHFISFLAALIFLTTIIAIPRLPRGRSAHRTAAIAAITLGCFMALLPLSPSLETLWFFLIPISVAVGICLTETTSMISSKALERELGRVMGTNQALLGVSRASAAASAGILAAIALPLPLIALGAVGILAGVLLLMR